MCVFEQENLIAFNGTAGLFFFAADVGKKGETPPWHWVEFPIKKIIKNDSCVSAAFTNKDGGRITAWVLCHGFCLVVCHPRPSSSAPRQSNTGVESMELTKGR